MRGSTHLAVMCSLMIAVAATGCSDDSTGPEAQRYGDLTDREHIIQNIEASYADRNTPRYVELLHEEFIWYGVKWSAAIGDESWYTRARDVQITQDLFDAALTLELLTGPGGWSAVDSLSGQPCADCWETDRSYSLTTQFTVGGPESTAEGRLRIIIVPVEDGSDGGRKEYRLRNAFDSEG